VSPAPPRILLVGGARSGKSRLAIELATTWDEPIAFVATATAGDADMAARIDRHRAERSPAWETVEAPADLTVAVDNIDPELGIVIDCITMWVANEMLGGATAAVITAAAHALAATLVSRPAPAIVVTNEVGSGVVPSTVSGREFRDLLGGVNRVLADRLDVTYLVVAGQVAELQRPGSAFPGLDRS